MLNVAPQKERIPDHLRAMAEQDDKSAASGKTGEQSSLGVGCAPGWRRARFGDQYLCCPQRHRHCSELTLPNSTFRRGLDAVTRTVAREQGRHGRQYLPMVPRVV